MCIYRRTMGSGGEHFFPIEPIRTYQSLQEPIIQTPKKTNPKSLYSSSRG